MQSPDTEMLTSSQLQKEYEKRNRKEKRYCKTHIFRVSFILRISRPWRTIWYNNISKDRHRVMRAVKLSSGLERISPAEFPWDHYMSFPGYRRAIWTCHGKTAWYIDYRKNGNQQGKVINGGCFRVECKCGFSCHHVWEFQGRFQGG